MFKLHTKLRVNFIVILILLSTNFNAQLLDSLTLANLPQIITLEEANQNPDAVIKLVLRKQKLKEFPKEIFTFKNLQYLDLSKNNFKYLPDSLNMLPNLQVLLVSKCGLEKLPAHIGDLKNLKHININQNNITRIPYSFGLLEKLEYADVWSNDLEAYPESLKELKKLRWMDLRNILIPLEKQNELKQYLPHAIIEFSPPCKCSW